MNDRRKRARARLDVYLNKYIAGVPYMARAADISREGVSLAHLIEPELSARKVGLQFQLPGCDEVIYAEGEVVRVHERSGVRFTLLTERHRRLIDAYVQRAESV
jgi:hypothetical protein